VPGAAGGGSAEVKAALALARRMRRPAPLLGMASLGAEARRQLPGEEPAVAALLAGPEACMAVLAAILARTPQEMDTDAARAGRRAPWRPVTPPASGADRTRMVPREPIAGRPQRVAPPTLSGKPATEAQRSTVPSASSPTGRMADGGGVTTATRDPRNATIADARASLRRSLTSASGAPSRTAPQPVAAAPAIPPGGATATRQAAAPVQRATGAAAAPSSTGRPAGIAMLRALEVLARVCSAPRSVGRLPMGSAPRGPFPVLDVATRSAPLIAATSDEAASRAAAPRSDAILPDVGAAASAWSQASHPMPTRSRASTPGTTATTLQDEILPAPARARPPLARLDDRDTALAEAAWRHGMEAP
jgi:hypothetical protein